MKFTINGSVIRCTDAPVLVSGSQNVYPCEFEFGPEWDGLSKTVIFRAGRNRVQFAVETECTVPWEVLKLPGLPLHVGVEGRDGGTVVRPTIWCTPGKIEEGASGGEPPQAPTPTAYDQLAKQVGNLADLETEDKSSLVGAVNEALNAAGVAGVSVTAAAVNEAGNLIITLSDGNTLDAGYVVGPPGSGGLGAQADMMDNDPESPGYIKNRTHYIGKQMTPILPETLLSNWRHNPRYGYVSSIPAILPIVEGDTYEVVLDGETYQCTAWDFDGLTILGDYSADGIPVFDVYPFAIAVFSMSTYVYVPTDGDRTLIVKGLEDAYIPLDERFIPESIARIHEITKIPKPTAEDEGKILGVVNGQIVWVEQQKGEVLQDASEVAF